MCGNPIFIVGFSGCNSRTFRVGCHTGVDFLYHVRSLATLGHLALLGEIRDDPDGIEEIADAGGAAKQDEVKEQTAQKVNFRGRWVYGALGSSQLRVKEACIGFNDSDSAVEGIQGVVSVL